MKKNILFKLVFIVIAFSSCGKKNEIINKYYPNNEIFERENITTIDIKDLTFSEIRNLVNKKQNQDSTVSTLISQGHYRNNIIFGISSPHAKRKSLLTVSTDSIFIDNGYKIEKLNKIMSRHYSNNGKNPLYPNSYRTAWIEIDLKDSSKHFAKTLLKVINVFDSIKSLSQDSLELKVLLKRVTPPPPPPLADND